MSLALLLSLHLIVFGLCACAGVFVALPHTSCVCVCITPNRCIFADHLLYGVSFRDSSSKSESFQHTLHKSISTLTLSKHLQHSLKMQGSLRYTNIRDITQCNCTYWWGFLLNDTTQLLLTYPNIFILSWVCAMDNHNCHSAGKLPQSCFHV